MEGLRAFCGLTPLELEDSIRTVRHASNGPQKELSGPLWGVLGTPLDGTGGLLHEQPGASPRQASHDVSLPSDLVRTLGVRRVRVGIIRDHIKAWCPRAIVDEGESPHEVRGDRAIAVATDYVALVNHQVA